MLYLEQVREGEQGGRVRDALSEESQGTVRQAKMASGGYLGQYAARISQTLITFLCTMERLRRGVGAVRVPIPGW